MLRIREMLPADIPAVAAIERDTFSMPWSEDALRVAAARRDTIYLTAELDGTVAGYCGLYNVVGEGQIVNVAVGKTYRRQGIARAMLPALLERGARAGITAFTLEVRSGNAAAIALYESFGFQTEGIRRDFYVKPREDALIMWRR